MNDPTKVDFPGPLGRVRESLITEFVQLGYAPSTIVRHMQLLAHLSRWMADHEVNCEKLSWMEIASFCSDRGITCFNRYAPRPVMVLMMLLHPALTPTKNSESNAVLPAAMEECARGFAKYIRDERGVAAKTASGYLYHVHTFASWLHSRGTGTCLDAVTITDVNQFLIGRRSSQSESSVRGATIALRAFFRWMYLTGRLNRNLADGIATGRHHVRTTMPTALPPEDLNSLLAADMSVRDRAIILLLMRLGLRAGEVADFALDDFDWRAGTVRVHGKAGDVQFMPVPAEVGAAIAGYLSAARPTSSSCRQVFLTVYPPFRPLSRVRVSTVVTGLALLAGIEGRVGAHRLRHSAATAVLAGGGTLAEAGQLLRHRSMQATAIYARSDQSALARLARPWPESVSGENAHE